MHNWRTSVTGIVGGLALILTQIYNVIDSDPATIFNYEMFLAGLGMIGIGWFAKDKNVSGTG